jgi:hypothetical protein
MRVGTTLAAVGLCLAATACNSDPDRAIMNKEDMLAASGFKFVPANSPERIAAFNKLPKHTFIQQVNGSKVVYIYADPTICSCLYVGGQKSYASYQAKRLQNRIADDKAQVATDMSYFNWDWGPWGVGYPTGFPYYLQ